MDEADRIWNRATNAEFVPTRPGDAALHAILQFHGLAMNGGLAHALEVDVRLGRDAAKAYRAIGADDHAALIDEALNLASPAVDRADKFDSLNLSEEGAAELDQLDERLPEDSEIERIFRRYLDSCPDDFDRA